MGLLRGQDDQRALIAVHACGGDAVVAGVARQHQGLQVGQRAARKHHTAGAWPQVELGGQQADQAILEARRKRGHLERQHVVVGGGADQLPQEGCRARHGVHVADVAGVSRVHGAVERLLNERQQHLGRLWLLRKAHQHQAARVGL